MVNFLLSFIPSLRVSNFILFFSLYSSSLLYSLTLGFTPRPPNTKKLSTCSHHQPGLGGRIEAEPERVLGVEDELVQPLHNVDPLHLVLPALVVQLFEILTRNEDMRFEFWRKKKTGI